MVAKDRLREAIEKAKAGQELSARELFIDIVQEDCFLGDHVISNF